MSVDFFLLHLLFLRVIRAVKYENVPINQSLTQTDFYFILLLSLLIHIIMLYTARTILFGLIFVIFIIYFYCWLDALLYKLFSVELGVGGIDVVFSNLWHEVMYMQRTIDFSKTNRTFIILPLLVLFYNISILVLKPFDQLVLTVIIIVPYCVCTIIAYPIKSPFIPQCGRSLIEDFIYSRYPNIPIGFCPRSDHHHLFHLYNPDKIKSTSTIVLKGSSVLLLTFESASSTHFASLNKKIKLTATTPFFDRLLHENETITSHNHFCLSPLTTPAHIALYTGSYTMPENKSLWHIRSLVQSGYTTIYLTSANVKLYGLYDVLKAAGFEYILDNNGLRMADSELLTKGIAYLESILDDKKPFFIHIHSANTHLPYFIETKLEQRMRQKSLNDQERFLSAIEQTDYIFEQIYLYVKDKVDGNLLTIISSDHGQAFGEYDYWTHGNAVIKQEINVPFIINHPKLVSISIHFSTHFDILPTILDLLGLDYFNGLGYSLFDQNRPPNDCLLWDGKPSRSTSTCFGLIINEKKYKLDLLRNQCIQSDWNDEQEQELTGNERSYFEALIVTVAQHRGIISYRNLNEKLLFDSLNPAKPRILVVTPTIWELDVINSSDLQDKYDFLITSEDVCEFERPWKKPFYNVHNSLQKVIDQYRNRIDGVLGTGDLYGCIFAAFISSKLSLPGSTIRSVILLSHKYYSRQFQKSIVPETVPAFDLINPFSITEPKNLHYPFFVKPVKGTMSILAQKVNHITELKKACTLSYRHLFYNWLWYRPLNQLLSSDQHNQISLFSFIAESYLFGKQVTVEGFIQNGFVTIMGIVDSIMYPNTNSFQRFEYPSTLPDDIQNRIIDITIRLMSKSGLNYTCFNVEMFYNESDVKISIIEINPRISYQFSDLFQCVDGISSFQIQIELSLGGKKIKWIRGNGKDKVAASFVMRRFTDAYVLRVPDQIQINRVIKRYPGSNVKILCHEGQRLSDDDQDIGSYRYAIVNMSAQTRDNLYQAYEQVQLMLSFDFSPV